MRAALYFEWKPNSSILKEAWTKGVTMTIKRIYPDPDTGKYDLAGLNGIKIEWEPTKLSCRDRVLTVADEDRPQR